MATAPRPKAQVQKQNVPVGTFIGSDGKDVSVYMTREHHQPLEQAMKLLNEALARLDAAGL